MFPSNLKNKRIVEIILEIREIYFITLLKKENLHSVRKLQKTQNSVLTTVFPQTVHSP